MKLVPQLEAIETREDLSRFVSALREDLLANESSWENPTLARFLEALGAWVLAMEGAFSNRGEPIPEQPSWRLVGDMLYAAKIYE